MKAKSPQPQAYIDNNYFYVKNQQGDITDITDSDGEVVASYVYDPWGKITSVSGSNIELANLNPFRYRSYYYDSDVQMYYLQSRYYDPEVCRFINADDVHYVGYDGTEISYNAWAYCGNNSINYIDANGLIFDDIKNIIGNLKNLNRSIVKKILEARLSELVLLDVLKRIRNSKNDDIELKIQDTKVEGVAKYTVTILTNNKKNIFVDTITFYIASWESWDALVAKIENNVFYKMYNDKRASLLISVYSLFANLYFNIFSAVTSVVNNNVCIFAKCSRATLKSYRENKNTNNMFIYITDIYTISSETNKPNNENKYIIQYEGDDGVNVVKVK